MVGNSKLSSFFLLRYPQTPTRASPGELLGGRGAEPYTPQKIMKYINSGVPNSGDFKNKISFPFRIHSRPEQGHNQGSFGGGAETYTQHKIM